MSDGPDLNDQRSDVLKATVPDVRAFAGLLRGVAISNRATITIGHAGLEVIVEEARTLLGVALIGKEIFEEYSYTPEQVADDEDGNPKIALEVPLNTLVECLNIFGTAVGSSNAGFGNRHRWAKPDDDSGEDEQGRGYDADNARKSTRSRQKHSTNGRIDNYFSALDGKGTSLRLSYAGAGYPLTLLLAEDSNGPTTTCEITTFDPEPLPDLPFDTTRIVLKSILKSSWLRDALSEIDPSCEKFTFIGNPSTPQTRGERFAARPRLRIQAAGNFGSAEMDYPNDREVLEAFECESTVSFSYRFAHILRTLRALQGSAKTSLRIDDEGLLNLQFLSPSHSPRGGGLVNSITEFKCLPLDEDA